MSAHFTVHCPKCQTVLIVDRISGQVLEVREALVTDSSGDRFEDALRKVKNSPMEAEEKFQKSREAEKNKHKDLDDLFQRSLDQVKKEGPVDRHVKDIDLE